MILKHTGNSDSADNRSLEQIGTLERADAPARPVRHRMTFLEFQKIFRSLVAAFQPRDLMPETLPTYYDALKAYPLELVAEVARLMPKTTRFFPTVGEWVIPTRALAAHRELRTTQTCAACGGCGLIRIHYHSGESFDVAICTCRAGQFYRQAGVRYVFQHLALSPDQQVAYLEDVDEAYR